MVSGLLKQVYISYTTSCQIIFDKKVRVIHLDEYSKQPDANIYDYVKGYVAQDMSSRIDDLRFTKKWDAFNFGSPLVVEHLNETKFNSLIQGKISMHSLERAKQLNKRVNIPVEYILCDEEKLPIKRNSIDLAMSCMNLHSVNDLVTCFKQVNQLLTDDSAFIGAMFGGDTLYELRSSLQLAELERLSGFSSHVSPKTTGQDIATLLQNAGFSLITVDVDEIRIFYPSIFELMFDLQAMGENSAVIHGSRHLNRDVLISSAAIYQLMYGNSDTDTTPRGIPATYQIIHFIGWKNPTKATPIKESGNISEDLK